MFLKILLVILWPIKKLVLKNPWQGAQTTIYCSIDDSLTGITGRYYSDCQEAKIDPKAEDEILAEKLWEISAELVQI